VSSLTDTELELGDFYTPQPVQDLFHVSCAKYPLMEGGRGGGKSTALLWEAISECLLVPGCNCLLLRRTLTAIEKGGIEDLFTKNVPRRVYHRYNASKHVVTFHNGSKLFFGHIKSDRDLLQYQGAEFLFIGWEELTQFTFSQWEYLKGSNRCPIKRYWNKGHWYKTVARMAGGTNPNGKGSQWVKALWITKKPPAGTMALGYDARDYDAIHSTYENNKIYANDAEYIRTLHSISDPYLRAAWIRGDWNILAGQFFSNWEAWFDEKKNRYVGRHIKTRRDIVFHDWEDRWISIDWGFEHHCVILWFARVTIRDPLADVLRTGKKERSIIVCYRELVLRKMNEFAIAEKIVEKNWSSAEDFDPIKYIYLSPDRFGKGKPEHSIAENMGDIFHEHKMPRPQRAKDDRVDGWRLTYTLLDTSEFAVLDTCTDTIESIPKLMRSEKDPEDAEKEGDDLFLDVCESLRYGLMSYADKAPIPEDVLIDERIKAIKDPTAKYMEYLRLTSRQAGSDLVLPIPPRGPAWRRGQ
jgi:phage terminase large subunit